MRNRLVNLLLTLLTIAAGLFSRTSYVPDIIYPYLGDALYALMIYFLLAFLFPKLSFMRTMLICIGICFTIEICQLYQADWIQRIRATLPGRLILGQGFLYSDLVAYIGGGIAGYFLETRLISRLMNTFKN